MGLALGSLAGSVLFPTQLPAGPKLTDNRTTTATIGEPVPIVFGTATIGGTVIWLAPYTQTSDDGGKGGPEQETYSYNQSIAIGLCESPLDGAQAIQGCSRIWENGTIMYDIRPQLAADTAIAQLAETDQQYANRLTASAAYAETFTLYLGSEEQTADPTIEAVEGFGNVPGFRGLAYIVYPNRLLQTAQGWRHPNFQFEVYTSGTGQCTNARLYSNDVLYPWIPGDGTADPSNPANVNTWQIVEVDDLLSVTVVDSPAPPHQVDIYTSNYENWQNLTFPTAAEAIALVNTFYGVSLDTFLGYRCANDPGPNLLSRTGAALASGVPGVPLDPVSVLCNYTFAQPHIFYSDAQRFANVNVVGHKAGAVYFQEIGTPSYGQIVEVTGPAYVSGDGSDYPPVPPFTGSSVGEFVSPDFEDGIWRMTSYTAALSCTRSPAAPLAPCLGLTMSVEVPGYAVRADGKLIQCTEWVKDTTHVYNVLQSYLPNESSGSLYPLGPCVPESDPDYANQTFWTDAYNAAVLAGQMPAGKVYGVDYPDSQSYAWVVDEQVCEGGGQSVSVADIISAVAQRAGLASSAIDVSDMESISVNGYSISSLSAGTDAIQPLRSIAFFDLVESGPVLRFVARGKPIVATLTTDDFGCYDAQGGNDGSSASNVPPALTVARADQTTLPRSIRFHYKSVSRDYQDAEQDSPYRLVTTSVNDQDVSLPFCLGDTQALQCAEILWADAWAGKTAYTLSVDQSLWAIEPGDAIGVPVDNVIQRMRIISDANSSGVLRKLNLVSDDEGAYISYAVAEAPQVQPQTLQLLTPTSADLLDLPALAETDNDPGFYVAAQRSANLGNAWKGCVFYKSVDGGTTWTTLFSMATEATIGTLNAPVEVSEAYTWDDSTEVVVNVNSSSVTFESRTDDAVLAGANAAAMGSDGRWEIVQFANAEQISTTQWRLSRLLRGRRGTEHNIGKSQNGDTLVILSTGDLDRIVLQSTEIGALRDYRATSIGAAFSSGTVYPFTGRGMALMPFSPVDVTATLQDNGDVLIAWIRRDRLGGTLMSGVDMPLSEATLAFQADIIEINSPSAPDLILRTLSSSTINVLYPYAQRVADSGSPPSGAFKVAIYQMSAIVGRGTAALAVLTV